jgi:hypothetical protein
MFTPAVALVLEPKSFEWKATADVILDKVRRCREAIVNN